MLQYELSEREQMSEHNAGAVTVVTHHGEGRSQIFIAQRVGINQSTVSHILRRYGEAGGYSRRPGQGRGKATTAGGKKIADLIGFNWSIINY
jgi:transposase